MGLETLVAGVQTTRYTRPAPKLSKTKETAYWVRNPLILQFGPSRSILKRIFTQNISVSAQVQLSRSR